MAVATTTSTLRKPQVRILEALAKAKAPMTRKEISEKAQVDNAFCTEYLGSADADVRAKNDAKFMSLLSLKAIKFGQPNEDTGAAAYEITATGRKLLEKSKADPAPAKKAPKDKAKE